MNIIQINRESESYEALATALGHVVLKLFTTRTNLLMAVTALVCLLCYLISGQHPVFTALVCMAWILHLAVVLTIDIAKGGARL